MVAGMAALPVLGLPVVPQGQPFLLVLAILAAAVLFGRTSALVAAAAASALGALVLLPSAGAQGDALRGGLSLVAFMMVAFGLAAATEAMRSIIALMDAADARRAQGIRVPVEAAPPGALRLLMMSPEQRRRR